MLEYNGYKITSGPDARLKKVEAIGRGSVHLSLRGFYTSVREAQKAIDLYLNKKEAESGETNSSS